MSDRAGYSADLMESLGKCRACGGDENYPMLVDVPVGQMICRNEFHSWRRRIAAFLYFIIVGERPAQRK